MDTLNNYGHQTRDEPNDIDLTKYLELVNNCDETDVLLSDTQLGYWLERIQLAQVPFGRLIQLNQALNVEQLIPTRSGLARDYRGLAELMGFSLVELEARFKRSHNPTKSLIEAYVDKRRHDRDQPKEATLNDLLKFLETLERFDIVDDFLPILIELAQRRQKLQHHQLHGPRSVAGKLETNSHDKNSNQALPETSTMMIANKRDRDCNHHQARYDAFVCYAPEDEELARELILLLEDHNKLIATDEHLLPGQLVYDARAQMIATECRKVIIVLTPNFLMSHECEFQARFANEIAIKSGLFPKIIPVLCETFDHSRLPPLIRYTTKIDMTNKAGNNREWQLKKLLHSLELAASLQDSPSVGLLCEPGAYDRGPGFHHHQMFSPAMHRGTPNSLTDSLHSDGGKSNMQGDQHQTTNRYYSNGSQPIVDLAHSQSSDSAIHLTQLTIMTSEDDYHHHKNNQHFTSSNRISTPSPSNSSQNLGPPRPSSSSLTPANELHPWYKKNWYKSFKQSLRALPKSPSGSISPSTSSQAQLVVQEPGDDKH